MPWDVRDDTQWPPSPFSATVKWQITDYDLIDLSQRLQSDTLFLRKQRCIPFWDANKKINTRITRLKWMERV